jgi:hypothetical protein
VIRALVIGAVLVVVWLLTWKAAPWLVGRIGRALGRRARPSPLLDRRLRRFRRIKRG